MTHSPRPSVTVCLPALNEAATVGAICASIRDDLMGPEGCVDQLLLVDSGSEDATMAIAAAAGAEVFRADEIRPDLADPKARGKGEAMWKSLAVATGDIIVWVDSDTSNFEARFVSALLQPLWEDPSLVMVKAHFTRPRPGSTDGGRVTEILARPLINAFWPDLAHIIQPLAGECAVRADAIRQLPFFTGYAVELGLLVDVSARFGAAAIGQADLGLRIDRAHPLTHLGSMSAEILAAAVARLESQGALKLSQEPSRSLVQFHRGSSVPTEVAIVERPPFGPLL